MFYVAFHINDLTGGCFGGVCGCQNGYQLNEELCEPGKFFTILNFFILILLIFLPLSYNLRANMIYELIISDVPLQLHLAIIVRLICCVSLTRNVYQMVVVVVKRAANVQAVVHGMLTDSSAFMTKASIIIG